MVTVNAIRLQFFVQRKLVVGLIEVLFDVIVLVSDFSPNLHALLEAEDTTVGDAKFFGEAVVDGAGNTNVVWPYALFADACGLINT